MVSLVTLEVYGIIVPLMAVLVSFVVPVAFFKKGVAGVVQLIERPLGGGVTILALIAVLTSFAFLFDFMSWQDAYQTRTRNFTDLSLKLQHDTKRLRLERNVYIHMLACSLSLSVKMIASLTWPRTVTAPQHAAAPQASAPAAAESPRTATHRAKEE